MAPRGIETFRLVFEARGPACGYLVDDAMAALNPDLDLPGRKFVEVVEQEVGRVERLIATKEGA